MSTDPITVNITSGGGSCYAGLGFYGLLRNCKAPIHTFCEGYAMSMGLIIFLAGDKRDCFKESTFMMHEISGGSDGKNYEVQQDAREMNRLNDMLTKILAERTKKPVTFWKKECTYLDKFYDKKAAKKLGILK